MQATIETPDQIPDYANALRLDGQGMVVLGAGQGMGAQTCHALSQAGARLLCVDSDAGRANEIAAAVGGEAVVADALKRQDVEAVFARAEARFGQAFGGFVDIIGVASNESILKVTDETWSWQYDIVVRHALYALQSAAPLLAKNGGGSMTFIGSISGEVAIHNQAAYGSAKAALHHLVRYAAQEFGPAGVRVNAIAPGFVRTPRLAARIPGEVWDRLGAENWMGRTAVPADIARAVLFLASDLARYVNGNILALDGGITNGVPLNMPSL